jgi:hypothetical protein
MLKRSNISHIENASCKADNSLGCKCMKLPLFLFNITVNLPRRWRLYYVALLISHFPIDSSPGLFMFSNFLGDRLWLMGAPNCWGPLVFELTLTNERYDTVCSENT